MNQPIFVRVHVPTKHAVELAVRITGSQQALADRFGLSQQAVNKWHTGGVPKKYWKPLLDICKHERIL